MLQTSGGELSYSCRASAGSKNGTFHKGERLPAKEATEILEGDTIAFSTVEMTGCTTRTFWRLVRG